MPQKWYESRTNQAALIGGVFLLLGTALAAILVRDSRGSYPTIEVKDLSPSGEAVLSRLALSPARQIIDSASFAELASSDLLWNDSLGVAIRRPKAFEWGVAEPDSLEGLSVDDVLIVRFFGQVARRGFGEDAIRSDVRFFGVRLDKPSSITVSKASLLDGTPIAQNTFRDPQFFLGFMRMTFESQLEAIPVDTLAMYQRDAIAMLDSVSKTYLPSTRRIYNGVFVARVSEDNLRDAFVGSIIRRPLLDRAVAAVRISTGAPTLLVVDRDRGTLIFSDVVHVQNAVLDGSEASSVTLNRAGYAVQRGPDVFVVMLQYVSNQPRAVLEELERLLASVRLRAGPA